jgi:hypothetical protein
MVAGMSANRNPFDGDLVDSIGFPAGWPKSRHNVAEWCRAVCVAGYRPDMRMGAPATFWLGADGEPKA